MSWYELKSKMECTFPVTNWDDTPVHGVIKYHSQVNASNEDLQHLDISSDIYDKLAQNIADEMLSDLGFKEDDAEKLKLVEDLSVESVRNLVELSKLLGRFSPEEIQRVITIYVGLYRLGEEKLNG